MSDKDINIKFNTKADTTGAKQTAEALKEVKKTSDELAQTNNSGVGAFDSYVKGAEKAQQAAERLKEAIGGITSMPDNDAFANAAKETARDIDTLLRKQQELLTSSRQSVDLVGLDEATSKIKELCQAYDQLFNTKGQVENPSEDVQNIIETYDKRVAAAEKAFDREEKAAAKALDAEIKKNQKATDSANKYFETYEAGQARMKMTLQQLYAEQDRYNAKLKEAQASGNAADIKDSVDNLKSLETQINAVTRRSQESQSRMMALTNGYLAMASGAIQAASALSGMGGAIGQVASLGSSVLQGAMLGGPWGAAFGAATKGVELLITKLGEADNAVAEFHRKQEEKALELDKKLLKIYGNLAVERQETALKRYSEGIDAIKTKWDEASRATKNHLSTLEAIADEERKAADAKFAAEKADLDQQLVMGAITQDEYDRQMTGIRASSELQQIENERSNRELQRKGHTARLEDATKQYDEANSYLEKNNLDGVVTPTQFDNLITSKKTSKDSIDTINKTLYGSTTKVSNGETVRTKGLLDDSHVLKELSINKLKDIFEGFDTSNGASMKAKIFEKLKGIIFSKNTSDEQIQKIQALRELGSSSFGVEDLEHIKKLLTNLGEAEKNVNENDNQLNTAKAAYKKLGATDADIETPEKVKSWYEAKKQANDEMESQKEASWKQMEQEHGGLDKLDATEPLFEKTAKTREDTIYKNQQTATMKHDKDYTLDMINKRKKENSDEIKRLKQEKEAAKIKAAPDGGQDQAALNAFKSRLLSASDHKKASLGKGLSDTLFSETSLMGQFIKDVGQKVLGGLTVDEEQAISKKFGEFTKAFRLKAGDGNRILADQFIAVVKSATEDLITQTKSGGEDLNIKARIAELERQNTQLDKKADGIREGKDKSWIQKQKEPQKAREEKKPIVEEVHAGAEGVKQAVESSKPEVGQIATSFYGLSQTIVSSNQSVSQAITSAVGSINGVKSSFDGLKAHADRMQFDLDGLKRRMDNSESRERNRPKHF